MEIIIQLKNLISNTKFYAGMFGNKRITKKTGGG